MWAMGLYSHVQFVKQGVPPRKIRFVGVLDAFRHAMREHGLSPTTGESLRELIAIAVIDDYLRVNKAGRDYPQQKQHKPPGPPHIRAATTSQKRKALQHQHVKPES
jgi:hypothetical protein